MRVGTIDQILILTILKQLLIIQKCNTHYKNSNKIITLLREMQEDNSSKTSYPQCYNRRQRLSQRIRLLGHRCGMGHNLQINNNKRLRYNNSTWLNKQRVTLKDITIILLKSNKSNKL